MSLHRTCSFLVLAFGLVGSPSVAAPVSAPKEIPVEDFFSKPTISNLRFSPNGKYILCLAPYERRQNLAVIDLERGTKKFLSSFKDKDVIQPFWASNERILFMVDKDGKEEYSVYAVNRDGSDPSNLVPERSFSFLKKLEGDAKTMLVKAAITHRDSWDVAHLNLKTGRLSSPVARAPSAGRVTDYIVDSKNQVRLAVARDGETERVLYRKENNTPWTEIASKHVDGPGWLPLAIDADDRTLFVKSVLGHRLPAVYKFDLDSLTMGELVYADETYEVESLMILDMTGKVYGVTYSGDRQRFIWLDEEMKRLHAGMEAALPDTVHRPIHVSEDGTKVIFQSYSDRDPGVYYLYDRTAKRASEIAVVKPAIDPEAMAFMKPVTYQARDGLTLHGYLTLPRGRDPKNLPLIIHPHGGPYGIRDEWGFNPEVQFYANRGFAVLQINYRGSGGYGSAFESLGYKKWGLEMQDDLSDGVAWAVKEGIADPKRVVISGASYGGYATMAGLTYTPELYTAGINYVGVTNIMDLLPKTLTRDDNYWFRTRIADLGKPEERKRVHDTSPVHFADRIRVPVLMAYGRNDPRVTISHAYDIERALKKNNKPYELIINDDEGHGFRDEENSIAFYKRVDAFLKTHVLADPGAGSAQSE